ncbi:hypothetical protein [Ruegeria atlantica]|uniref:hypothetical protein n=1 Tax=Ruegeria atlantica TaxID=81569 RepID=UPI002493F793|nr:hypothetical protein [Ruegeria atlantica]
MKFYSDGSQIVVTSPLEDFVVIGIAQCLEFSWIKSSAAPNVSANDPKKNTVFFNRVLRAWLLPRWRKTRNIDRNPPVNTWSKGCSVTVWFVAEIKLANEARNLMKQ